MDNKKYLIVHDGKYMVRSPYWDAGVWTDNPLLAELQDEDGKTFYEENYPQFKVVEYEEGK